jgi:SpoVK/Ycf46/Vps4 family AAA+-type ATPase
MTGFGQDWFTDAERHAAVGWQVSLVTPDGVNWLINPGGPWLRWAGPNGWLPSQPPADPAMRFGAHRVPSPGLPEQPHGTPQPAPGQPMPGQPSPGQPMSGYQPAPGQQMPGQTMSGYQPGPGQPVSGQPWSPAQYQGQPSHQQPPHLQAPPQQPPVQYPPSGPQSMPFQQQTPPPGYPLPGPVPQALFNTQPPSQQPAPSRPVPAQPAPMAQPMPPAPAQHATPMQAPPMQQAPMQAAPTQQAGLPVPMQAPPPPPPPLTPQPVPVVESVKIGSAIKSFVSVGESAWGFLDRVVRVVKWTAEARADEKRENQPNPILVLVGEPHSGQLMLSEALRQALFDAKATPGNKLSYDTGKRVHSFGTDAEVGSKLEGIFNNIAVRDKKVYLVREADAMITSDEARDSLCRGLAKIAVNRNAEGILVLSGTEKFLAAVKAGTSASISDSFVYRLPSFGQAAVRGTLLDVLAQEGGAVLTPPARARLVEFTGECHEYGSVTGGDVVVSALEMATRSAVVRGSMGYDSRVVVDLPDLTELVAPRREESDVEAPKTAAQLVAELDAMIGLSPVKQRVHSLLNELAVDRQRKASGLKVATRSRHLVFTGNPGTAKTTVARLLAQVYKSLGLLESGHVVEVQRADLVGEFVGKTAPKTRAVCEKAMGGVLFIDEAYELTPRSDNDFGAEAIAELLTQMENHRDELIVIAAGYPKQMDQFLDANPGMRSRFANRVDFPDYSNAELAKIFESMAEHEGYLLAPELLAALPGRMARVGRGSGFANGRSARALLEATLSAQSGRLTAAQAARGADAADTDGVTLNQLVLADLPEPGGDGVGQTDDAGPRRGLADLMTELDSMIGLDAVKQEVKSISAEIRVDARRRAAGLKVGARSRHLVFTGNPGTAKTTVARLLAQIYRELGVLSSGHLVECGRPDFVAGFVGQTGPKTRKLCERAMGGVLFVDEAYELVSGDGKDFGKEAVAELLVQMENHRDDFVVIAAGYPKDMDGFLDANSGLRSRFGEIIAFPDYTDAEMAGIFQVLLRGQGYRLSPELQALLPEVISKIDRGRGFANGRSVRALVEQMVECQSLRLAGPDTDIDAVPADELTLLVVADVPPAYRPSGATAAAAAGDGLGGGGRREGPRKLP